MAERIRVLWLTKGLGPGGAEKLLCLFAQAGDRDRFDYHAAYLLPWKGDLVPELRSLGVAVHCLHGEKEWDLRWAQRLRRLLVRIDLIHTQTPYVSGVARLVARTLPPGRRPVTVSTEHVPWSSYVPAARWLNAVTFPLDAAHIAVSPETERSIPRAFRVRVQTLFQGIDVATVRDQGSCRAEARLEMGIETRSVSGSWPTSGRRRLTPTSCGRRAWSWSGNARCDSSPSGRARWSRTSGPSTAS